METHVVLSPRSLCAPQLSCLSHSGTRPHLDPGFLEEGLSILPCAFVQHLAERDPNVMTLALPLQTLHTNLVKCLYISFAAYFIGTASALQNTHMHQARFVGFLQGLSKVAIVYTSLLVIVHLIPSTGTQKLRPDEWIWNGSMLAGCFSACSHAALSFLNLARYIIKPCGEPVVSGTEVA